MAKRKIREPLKVVSCTKTPILFAVESLILHWIASPIELCKLVMDFVGIQFSHSLNVFTSGIFSITAPGFGDSIFVCESDTDKTHLCDLRAGLIVKEYALGLHNPALQVVDKDFFFISQIVHGNIFVALWCKDRDVSSEQTARDYAGTYCYAIPNGRKGYILLDNEKISVWRWKGIAPMAKLNLDNSDVSFLPSMMLYGNHIMVHSFKKLIVWNPEEKEPITKAIEYDPKSFDFYWCHSTIAKIGVDIILSIEYDKSISFYGFSPLTKSIEILEKVADEHPLVTPLKHLNGYLSSSLKATGHGCYTRRGSDTHQWMHIRSCPDQYGRERVGMESCSYPNLNDELECDIIAHEFTVCENCICLSPNNSILVYS